MSNKAKLLKIYVGEKVRSGSRPLYKAIVAKLKDSGIAGVTVIRGIEGYGKQNVIHTARLLELSADLPIIIESVDAEAKILKVLPEIASMVDKGLVITADINIEKWG